MRRTWRGAIAYKAVGRAQLRRTIVLGLRIALQTRCLAQPLKQALLTAGRLGYAGVGVDARRELPPAELSDTGLRQLRKMLDDLNLRVATVAFPTRRGYAVQDDLDRRVAATFDAMRMASRLGAGVLFVTPGPLPAAESADHGTLIDALTTLAAQGGRLGVLPVLRCPDAEPAELGRLTAALPEGLAGVDLSPAEVIRHGRSPRELVRLSRLGNGPAAQRGTNGRGRRECD
jgi:hypothetical protein